METGQTSVFRGMSEVLQGFESLGRVQAQQIALQERERLGQIMQGMADMKGTPVELMEKAGEQALRQGMPDAAEKMFGRAGALRQQIAHSQLYESQAQDKAVEADVAKIDQFGSLATMYPDSAAGWEAVKASYMANNPNPTPLEMQVMSMPYRPGIAAAVKTQFMSAKDKMLLQLKQQQIDNAAANAGNNLAMRQMMIDLRERDLALRQEREARLAKTGDMKAPTKTDISTASGLVDGYLQSAGYSTKDIAGIPASVKQSFATQIADDAFTYMRKGTNRNDAFDQALADNADRLITTQSTLLGASIPGTSRLEIKPRADVAPAAPAAQPKPAAAPQSQFSEGDIYRDAKGKKAKYQGGKWIPVKD